MTFSSLRSAPLLSLRHASVGRLGEQGRLPPGWKPENVARLEIEEVDFVESRPAVTLRLELAPDPPIWSSLSLGPHLAAAGRRVIALAGQVRLQELAGIDQAMLSLREWRTGGELVRQADWPFQLAREPQVGAVALEIGGEGHLVQPLITFRRKSNMAGEVTACLTGLTFGCLQENPRWLWA